MPLVVRPPSDPTRPGNREITTSNLDGPSLPQNGNDTIRLDLNAQAPGDAGAWVLSSQTVDASGNAVDTIPLSPTSGPCAPSQQGVSACLAEIKRLGYRQLITYQPSSRYWAFQWCETGIYTALAVGLAGFCFWRIRRGLS
jgi:hypothetical protein